MAAAVIPACRKRAAKEKPLCLKDRETSDCLEEERGEREKLRPGGNICRIKELKELKYNNQEKSTIKT